MFRGSNGRAWLADDQSGPADSLERLRACFSSCALAAGEASRIGAGTARADARPCSNYRVPFNSDKVDRSGPKKHEILRIVHSDQNLFPRPQLADAGGALLSLCGTGISHCDPNIELVFGIGKFNPLHSPSPEVLSLTRSVSRDGGKLRFESRPPPGWPGSPNRSSRGCAPLPAPPSLALPRHAARLPPCPSTL